MSSKTLMLAVIVVAVVAGLMGGVGNFLYLKQQEPKGVSFLVAKRTIEAKETLSWGDNVTSISVPEKMSESFRRFAIERANLDLAEGKMTYDKILAGEPILSRFVDPLRPKAALFDENNVAAGSRAISIPVGREASVSNIVQAGDHVDILGTFTIAKEQRSGIPSEEDYLTGPSVGAPPSEKTKELLSLLIKPADAGAETGTAAEVPTGPFTQTILQNMLVVGTGDEFRQEALPFAPEFPGDYDVVTFKVSPVQAELLTFAQAIGGQLTLVLRHPDDSATAPRAPMTMDAFAAAIQSGGSDSGTAPQPPTAPEEKAP